MRYVDGFVLIIQKKNLDAYKKLATKGGKLWKKHGALEYMETVGDDMQPDMGGMALTFPKLTGLKPNEIPVFSYIVFKSRKHRDQVNAKVMKDPAMNPDKQEIPFDMSRMAYGGFQAIVDM